MYMSEIIQTESAVSCILSLTEEMGIEGKLVCDLVQWYISNF